MSSDVKEMTDAEILERIIRLGFDGDSARFEVFKETLREGLPEGTGVALRGSVVTNQKFEDGQSVAGGIIHVYRETFLGVESYHERISLRNFGSHPLADGNRDLVVAGGVNADRAVVIEDLQRCPAGEVLIEFGPQLFQDGMRLGKVLARSAFALHQVGDRAHAVPARETTPARVSGLCAWPL